MSALKKQVGGSHYKDMAIQPIEFIEKNGIGYSHGVAISYLARAGRKPGNDERQEVQKAIHTMELWLEMNPARTSIDDATPEDWDGLDYIEPAKFRRVEGTD